MVGACLSLFALVLASFGITVLLSSGGGKSVTETIVGTGTCSNYQITTFKLLEVDFGDLVSIVIDIDPFATPEPGGTGVFLQCIVNDRPDINFVNLPGTFLLSASQLSNITTVGPNAPYHPFYQDVPIPNYLLQGISNAIRFSWHWKPSFSGIISWNFANTTRFVIGNGRIKEEEANKVSMPASRA